MGHVAQTEGNRDAIEPIVGEGQLFGVALRDRQHVALVGQTIPTTRQHRIVDVGQPDLAAFVDTLGKGQREISRATGHIEHARAFAHAAALDGEGLPEAVHAAGHQVVHQIVAAGHGVENIGDPPGFFLLGDGFVAEMGSIVFHDFSDGDHSRRLPDENWYRYRGKGPAPRSD